MWTVAVSVLVAAVLTVGLSLQMSLGRDPALGPKIGAPGRSTTVSSRALGAGSTQLAEMPSSVASGTPVPAPAPPPAPVTTSVS